MAKDEVIVQLIQVFRRYGYEGATLSKISEATGLGRASLYHYFPGGKEDMAIAVLNHIQHWFEVNIMRGLKEKGTPIARLKMMAKRMDEFYGGGQKACLFAVLSLVEPKDLFSARTKTALTALIDGIAEVIVQAGISTTVARQRAEDAILQIQGALVFAQTLEDTAPFQRVLKRLPEELLRA
jgi:TetR/AcrR family transcriptional regulator, lmrAB and yxaGH operons repressor